MPVDQGLSQRRSVGSDYVSMAGQAAAATPQSSSGESYFQNSFGPAALTDEGSTKFPGIGEANITKIGNLVVEVSSDASRSQVQSSLVLDGTDLGPTARAGAKQTGHTPLGASPVSSNQSTSQVNAVGYPPDQIATPSTTLYKLLAYDSVTKTPVRWVSAYKDLSNAPASPDGNPLTSPPTVEAQWDQ